MAIFPAALDEGFAVGLALKRGIGLAPLAVARHPVPFQVTQMGVHGPAHRPRIFGARRAPLLRIEPDHLALTTTRRARNRPAESLCHSPSTPCRANEATTFAPRPRALNRPVLLLPGRRQIALPNLFAEDRRPPCGPMAMRNSANATGEMIGWARWRPPKVRIVAQNRSSVLIVQSRVSLALRELAGRLKSSRRKPLSRSERFIWREFRAARLPADRLPRSR